MQEQHRIQGRDVHAFGQAAGVAQDSAFPFGDWGFQPGELFVALQGVEGAIDMVDLAHQVSVGALDLVAVVFLTGQRLLICRYDAGNRSATCLEVAMSLAKATARCIAGSPGRSWGCHQRWHRRVWPARSSNR